MLKKIFLGLSLIVAVAACGGCGNPEPEYMSVYCGNCGSDYWYEVYEYEEEGHYIESLHAKECSACEMKEEFLDEYEEYLEYSVHANAVWAILEEELPYERALEIYELIIYNSDNCPNPLGYFYN